MPMASSRAGVEMFQKGRVPSVFVQPPRPMSRASDTYETEFEDDEMSDFEEYGGRRSEDSVGAIADPATIICLTRSDSSETVVIRRSRHSKNYEHRLPTISMASISNYQRKESQVLPSL